MASAASVKRPFFHESHSFSVREMRSNVIKNMHAPQFACLLYLLFCV